MNKNFQELIKCIEEGQHIEVSFPCYPSNNGTGVYPKEIDCLEINSNNSIIAVSRSGNYLITDRSAFVKNNEYSNLFHVYDDERNEALTIII